MNKKLNASNALDALSFLFRFYNKCWGETNRYSE